MARDHRSVGELLLDADMTARSMMLDLDVDRAEDLARSWPGMVRAARDFWDALPQARRAGKDRDEIPEPPMLDRLKQLTRIAGTVDKSGNQMVHPWPRLDAVDADLSRITQDFQQAATLMRLHSPRLRESGQWTQQQTNEIQELCARGMHALYVSSHAAASTCGEFSRFEAMLPRRNTRARAPGIRAGKVSTMLQHAELVTELGTHDDSHLAPAQPADPAVGADRLHQALREWDAATSSLGQDRLTVGQIRWIARIDRSLTANTAAIAQAGRDLGVFSGDGMDDLLEQLSTAHRQWATVDRTVAPMMDGTDMPPPRQVHAGNELLATLGQLTWDHHRPADPAQIAERLVDLGEAARLLRTSLNQSEMRAQDFLAANRQQIVARARPLQRQWQRSIEASPEPDKIGTPISSRDVYQNVFSPLPARQLGDLKDSLKGVPMACSNAAAQLDRMAPGPGRGSDIARQVGAGSPEARQRRRERLDQMLALPVPVKDERQPLPPPTTRSIRDELTAAAAQLQHAARRTERLRARLEHTETSPPERPSISPLRRNNEGQVSTHDQRGPSLH